MLHCTSLISIVHIFTQPLDGAAIRQLILSGLAAKMKPAPSELSFRKPCCKAFDAQASTYNTGNLRRHHCRLPPSFTLFIEDCTNTHTINEGTRQLCQVLRWVTLNAILLPLLRRHYLDFWAIDPRFRHR
jgi:hypothetical protein